MKVVTDRGGIVNRQLSIVKYPNAAGIANKVGELHDATFANTLSSRHCQYGGGLIDNDGIAVVDFTGRCIVAGTTAVEGIVDDRILRGAGETDFRTLVDEDTRCNVRRRRGNSLEEQLLYTRRRTLQSLSHSRG